MYLDIYLERVFRKYVCVGDTVRKSENASVCVYASVPKEKLCEFKNVRDRINIKIYILNILYTKQEGETLALEEEKKRTRFILCIVNANIVYGYNHSNDS